jgi:hypothetical protein
VPVSFGPSRRVTIGDQIIEDILSSVEVFLDYSRHWQTCRPQ